MISRGTLATDGKKRVSEKERKKAYKRQRKTRPQLRNVVEHEALKVR